MRQCCSKYSWRAPAGWVSKSVGKRSGSSDTPTRASSVLVSELDAFEHQQVFIRVVLFRQSFWRGFFLSVFLFSGGRFNWCLLPSLQHGQRSSRFSIMALLAQERFNFHVLSPEAG